VIQVFRLVLRQHAAEALSGEGARLFGGRWNPPGAAVVYASASRALAVLEVFVHLTEEARAMSFVLYSLELPRRARLRRHGEPSRSMDATQEAGRAWLDEGSALALVVPSVLVPQEHNYVLDVRHAQFAHIKVSKPEPFSFDERLWR
jgi:RES domain-containing protein